MVRLTWLPLSRQPVTLPVHAAVEGYAAAAVTCANGCVLCSMFMLVCFLVGVYICNSHVPSWTAKHCWQQWQPRSRRAVPSI